MHDINGIEVCRQLKQDELLADAPVIFVTSLERRPREIGCWEAGAVDFVLKPINAESLRQRINVHLTLKFQSDLLRQMAYLDGLTGIFNRRYFDLHYQKQLKQNYRSGASLSLLLIDIDYFKSFNDTLWAAWQATTVSNWWRKHWMTASGDHWILSPVLETCTASCDQYSWPSCR